ncbi:Hypothetical protein FKW44_019792 [Caligus rogercresseyi]|uniref:Uncharacterized protein n=1 Tax=Caligus rogercresseyi TaxID=217165 RepID=A0A7T8JXR6_CALRO|nr:Hypothetical protein FKW44_019792 [Caligus rogercresseyi]
MIVFVQGCFQDPREYQKRLPDAEAGICDCLGAVASNGKKSPLLQIPDGVKINKYSGGSRKSLVESLSASSKTELRPIKIVQDIYKDLH